MPETAYFSRNLSGTASPTKRVRSRTLLKQAFAASLETLSPEETEALAIRTQTLWEAQKTQSPEEADLLSRLGVVPIPAAETLLSLAANTARLQRERQEFRRQSVTGTELGRRLNRTRQWVHQCYQKGKLLAFRDGDHLFFPLWQIDAAQADYLVQGLRAVWSALELTDLGKMLWLTSSCRLLEGRTPLDVLRSGEADRVLHEAESVGKMA